MTKRFDIMSPCVKCGATNASVKFNPNQDWFSKDTLDVLTPEQRAEFHNAKPYMERICCVCSYSWKERPLDATGE